MPTFHIGKVPVEFVDQGRGEPVLLLHSSGSSRQQWRSLIERLSCRFRVLAPDLYGYGATGMWRGIAPFTLGDEGQIVHALLGRCGEPAHLVGHSYGGAVALHVARARGDLIRSLALIEPVAFHLLRDAKADAAALDEISRIAAAVESSVGEGNNESGCRGFVDYWSGPGAWAAIPEAKRATLAAQLPKVALDFQAILHDSARLHDFRLMAVPTLVIQGELSPSPTRRICERLVAGLPEARFATVPGAGHMCPVTHREETNELLAAFLSDNSRRKRLAGPGGAALLPTFAGQS